MQMDPRTRSGVANVLAAPSPMVTKVAIPVANMRAMWNAWPDLREARTKNEAKRVIKKNILELPIWSKFNFAWCDNDIFVKILFTIITIIIDKMFA